MGTELQEIMGKAADEKQTTPAGPDKVDELKNTVNSLATKLDALAEATAKIALGSPVVPQIAPEPIVDDNIDPDLAKIIDQRVNAAVSRAKKETVEQMTKTELQKFWDAKADKDFDRIFNQNNPKYRSEYKSMVQSELKTLTDPQAPDAVYNACARVMAKCSLTDELNATRTAIATHGFTESSSPAISRTNAQNAELSSEQKYIASRLGISEEKYRQVHGLPRNLRKMNQST